MWYACACGCTFASVKFSLFRPLFIVCACVRACVRACACMCAGGCAHVFREEQADQGMRGTHQRLVITPTPTIATISALRTVFSKQPRKFRFQRSIVELERVHLICLCYMRTNTNTNRITRTRQLHSRGYGQLPAHWLAWCYGGAVGMISHAHANYKIAKRGLQCAVAPVTGVP